MKKILLLPILLVLSWLVVWPAAQSDRGQLQYVDVYWRQDGKAKIIASGRVGDTEILVPAYILADKLAATGAKFDRERGYLQLERTKSTWLLETPALDERLKQGVKLEFAAQLYEGDWFLNIQRLQAILGLIVDYDSAAKRLYLEEVTPGHQLPKPQLNTVRPMWQPVGKLNLVWDYIPKKSPDLTAEQQITGLDVISPTWFKIAKDGQNLINNADFNYVAAAHAKGYKVWPLFKNGDFDPDLTSRFLANKTWQDRVINQLLVYTAVYNLDGINIDFENIYEHDRDRLTAFVARLATALRQQNVVSSVDVTVAGTSPMWSRCYDRRELAKVVDYVMVMTYDEYWASSPVAGPVASLNWVESNLKMLIDPTSPHYIPREKLVLGIPFYAREWQETRNAEGKVRVRSQAHGMAAIKQKIDEQGLEPVWLPEQGLFYVEYHKDDSRYRIWIEDEHSIAKKLALVNTYDIAGAASWRKGFEQLQIWPILYKQLKQTNAAIK